MISREHAPRIDTFPTLTARYILERNKKLGSMFEKFRPSQDPNLGEQIENVHSEIGTAIAAGLVYQFNNQSETFIEASAWLTRDEKVHEFSQSDIKIKIYDPQHKHGSFYNRVILSNIRYPGLIDDSLQAYNYFHKRMNDNMPYKNFVERTLNELKSIQTFAETIQNDDTGAHSHLRKITNRLVTDRILSHERFLQYVTVVDFENPETNLQGKYAVTIALENELYTIVGRLPRNVEKKKKFESLLTKAKERKSPLASHGEQLIFSP